MKKGLIGFLAMSTLFSLAVVGNSNKVEAALDGFTLVTSANDLVIGNTYYISNVDETYVLGTTQNDNNRAAVAFDDNNKGNFQTITLGQGNTSGTYAFNVESGYLYAASSTKNYMRTETSLSANSSWAITIDTDGIVTAVAQGSNSRNNLRFNPNSGTPIFSCYAETSDMAKVKLWSAAKTTDAEKVHGLVGSHYNDGTYTKKSNIYVSDTAENFDLASVFHKPSDEAPVYKDRTTYYTPTALLMGDYDGGFDDINSGYRNGDDGHMWHYSINSSNEPVNDWKVNNTTIQEFYVTLDKMLEDNYFEGWTVDKDGKATYEVEDNQDEFVKDFLAFTAPCLEPVVLGSTYSNYFDIVKLEIEAVEGYNGDYLALRIYVDSTNIGAVSNSKFILSEARIYAGNELFDENLRIVTINAPEEGGSIECNVDISKPVKLGDELTFTVKADDNYEISLLKINDSDKLSSLDENGQITWTVEADVNVKVQFKTTIIDETKYLYDFTATAGTSSEYDKTKLLDVFKGAVVGENIVSAVTATSKMYGANTGQGPKQPGLKSGTSSAAGSFTITTSKAISKVTVVCYAWSSSSGDTVQVNNGTAQKAGASSAATLVFEINSTDTISFKFNKRVVISSITFE